MFSVGVSLYIIIYIELTNASNVADEGLRAISRLVKRRASAAAFIVEVAKTASPCIWWSRTRT